MEHTYLLGYIDFNKTGGRKTFPVTAEVKFNPDDDCLTVIGNVVSPKTTNAVLSGDILDQLKDIAPELFLDSRNALIAELWSKYQARDFTLPAIPEDDREKIKLVAQGKIYKALVYTI